VRNYDILIQLDCRDIAGASPTLVHIGCGLVDGDDEREGSGVAGILC